MELKRHRDLAEDPPSRKEILEELIEKHRWAIEIVKFLATTNQNEKIASFASILVSFQKLIAQFNCKLKSINQKDVRTNPNKRTRRS
jgi:hypothetical protein